MEDKMCVIHVHFKGAITKRILPFVPRTGETIRFPNEEYGIVTEVIWCFDEPNTRGQRVNLRVESDA